MWRDRFSQHPTPVPSPPPTRNFSPAPRRSLQLPRPGLPTRTASTSLLSQPPSSSNLPHTAKFAGGSSLKTQINATPPEDIPDPSAVLEAILGTSVSSGGETDPNNGQVEADDVERPSSLSEDVEFGSQSLQQFLNEHHKQDDSLSSTPYYSKQSVEEYGKEKDQFEELHMSITGCDDVLKSVEKYLASFQKDLKNVSAEIETLQSRSTALNAKLESRQKVEGLLGPVVEQISLAPDTVRKIIDGPIDASFVKSVDDLVERSKAIEANITNGKDKQKKAILDLKPLVEDLSDKAAERIKDYFASRIRSLRSPNINAQILQNQDFLKQKPLFAFLAKRQPQLAQEIVQAYVNTMRWYYSGHFIRYREALGKLKVHAVEKGDMIGEDPNPASRSNASSNTSASPAKLPGSDPFSLGRRLDILRQPSSTALPASAAEESKSPVHLETPFLSFNLALIDNASSEYVFLSSFLPPRSSSHASISRYINAIFTPTFELGNALTKFLITESSDALGLLLCVRLTQHFAFLLQRRKNPTLDSYVNGTSMLLWPRFQQVLDAHCESLKRLAASLPTRPVATAAFATLSGASSSNAASTAPHPVTQRFANLLCGILILSAEARDDEPVGSSVTRLRGEFEGFLTKMAQAFGSGEKGKRERERFLGNNYSLVLTVLEGGFSNEKGDGGSEGAGRLAVECREHFEALRRPVGGP